MKTLKLTILLEEGTSKAELANTFGEPIEINLSFKYLQFSFTGVKMLTAIQLTPIYNLIVSYEKQQKQKLRFKMFHLQDDIKGTYSPISLQHLNHTWSVVSSMTGMEMSSSPNLLTLI